MGGAVHTIAKEFRSGNYGDYFSLLIVVPEDVKSCETVHVLNYFGFPFQLEEDNVVKGIIKREMGFHNEDPYPCLVVESSLEDMPNLDLSGQEDILQTLIKKGFIKDHYAHSAREK